jgi:hypothetical protein
MRESSIVRAQAGRWSEEAVSIFPLPPGRYCMRRAVVMARGIGRLPGDAPT